MRRTHHSASTLKVSAFAMAGSSLLNVKGDICICSALVCMRTVAKIDICED
jgi:hypothetical protein